jgi:Dolichyl-phosphate-mannose-protein mannosyltransferase
MRLGLPLAGYVFMLFMFRARGSGWRAAIIGAATVWGIVVVLITELLSLPRELTRMNLTLAWLAVDGVALVCAWWVAPHKVMMKELLRYGERSCQVLTSLMTTRMLWLWGLGAIVLLVAIVALLSPPNTTDAMTYHMPRVMYWMQQRSVAFYPAADYRQLHMPPWSEFAMLHIHILFGSDRFDPLVQWFCFLGSIIGVSLLAQRLGASPRGQLLAAIVCATIPQGILEASGAKNDYVMAFWCVALTYYLLAIKQQPTWPHALGMGGALGLAWLTKGTANIFSFALVVTWILAWPWRAKLRALRFLPLVLLLAIAINAGHFVRNYRLYGSPLGPKVEEPSAAYVKYTNDVLTASTLVSNSVRNLGLHLGTPIQTVNRTLEQGIAAIIHAVGEEVNNPQTTWGGNTFQIPEMSRHEAVAGNPLHLMLIVLTLVVFISWALRRRGKAAAIYAASLVLAFEFFCALLKWQPWHTRLHLPLFVLWAAPVGMMLGEIRSRAVIHGVSLLLFLQASPFVLANQLRPLVFDGMFNILSQDRSALYFSDGRHLLEAYRTATALIKKQGCRHVGLDATLFSFEYPLLALLDVDRGKRSITHVGVQNLSARYGEVDEGVELCAVICLGCAAAIEKWKAYTTEVGPGTIVDDMVVFRATGASLAAPAQDGPPLKLLVHVLGSPKGDFNQLLAMEPRIIGNVPSLAIATDRPRYQRGDILTVTVNLANSDPRTVDAYVALIGPHGVLSFWDGKGFLQHTGGHWVPLVRGEKLPQGVQLSGHPLLSWRLVDLATGPYSVSLVLTEPDLPHIIAKAQATFTLEP